MLDAARRKFLSHQQVTRESELKRMDKQILKKTQQRERETRAVMDDIQTRTVELQRQKALLEQELARCEEEVCVCVAVYSFREGFGQGFREYWVWQVSWRE